MRITAKQIETLSNMIPVPARENFTFELSQSKGKPSLRVQDGKLTYKLKADGSFGGTMPNPGFNTPKASADKSTKAVEIPAMKTEPATASS